LSCIREQVVDVEETREQLRAKIQGRLRRVEGQIRGIQRMVDEGRECEAIVTQLMAARAALDKASLLILKHQINYCLKEAPDQEADLDRLLGFLLHLTSED
jgi:DNA-binding FrmR family transcriptional regulator